MHGIAAIHRTSWTQVRMVVIRMGAAIHRYSWKCRLPEDLEGLNGISGLIFYCDVVCYYGGIPCLQGNT